MTGFKEEDIICLMAATIYAGKNVEREAAVSIAYKIRKDVRERTGEKINTNNAFDPTQGTVEFQKAYRNG